jgi:DNA-binding YbaB/EbfC family protein
MKNIGQLMKQAQEMQAKMQQMQERLAEIEVTGASGAGMVTVTLNGKSEVRAVKIDPKLLDGEEAEVVEDLIVAAFTDAKGKVEARAAEEMSKLTGGLDLPPGFNLPF